MYINLITRIRNAQAAGKESLKVPFSNMDMKIAELLVKHKFIQSADKKGRAPKRIIEIKPLYKDGGGAISGVRFLSKPSRKLYSKYKNLRTTVRQGFGIGVVSTSRGILTMEEAKKDKVGGQRLFEIW